MNDIIFIKPKSFEDSKRIVNYIVEDKILHINLFEVDKKVYRRILDFISGAIYLKEASLQHPSEKIFLSIPKEVSYSCENEHGINSHTSSIDLRYNEEEEIKQKF